MGNWSWTYSNKNRVRGVSYGGLLFLGYQFNESTIIFSSLFTSLLSSISAQSLVLFPFMERLRDAGKLHSLFITRSFQREHILSNPQNDKKIINS